MPGLRQGEANFRRDVERHALDVQRSINDCILRLDDQVMLNVKDYGAVGDGVTDDTVALQAAFARAMTEGFVLSLSPNAVYACLTWTDMATTGPLTIVGHDASFLGPVSLTGWLTPQHTCRLYNVGLTRWDSGLECSVADGGSLDGLVVDGCAFTNINRPIAIEVPCTNYRIERSQFDDINGGYAIRIGWNDGASEDTWSVGWILANGFNDIRGSTSAAAALIYGQNVVIADNIVQDVYGLTTNEAWGFYTKTRYAAICNNVVRNVNTNSHADVVGINIKGLGRGAPTVPQGFSVTCTGNVVESVGTSNVKGSCIRAQTDNVVIGNNVCDDGGIIGIVADEADGSDNIVITGNAVYFSTPTGTTGIYIATGGTGHIITQNSITGASRGIRLATGTSAAGSNYMVSQNTIEADTAAVSINTSLAMDSVTILGNTLVAGARGFLNDSGAGAITNLDIMDNDFHAATTALIGGVLPVGSRVRQFVPASTTSATPLAVLPVSLADESAWSVTARIVGRKSDTTDRAAYYVTALVYRDAAGAATIQGAVGDIAAAIESNAAWDGTIGVSGDTVRAVVTGFAATTISWMCSIEIMGA